MQMQVNRNNIIRKIDACLRLAKSSEPHEAAAALRQAQKLMQQHGISEEEVAVRESTRTTDAKARQPFYQVELVKLIASAFGVQVCFVGQRNHGLVCFVGLAPREELAAYAYDALWRQVKTSRQQYIKGLSKRMLPHNKRIRGDAFAHGWVTSVSKMVQEFALSAEELELTENAMLKLHPGLTSVTVRPHKSLGSSRQAGAVMDGMDAGANVKLRHAMNAGRQPPRIDAGIAGQEATHA